MAASSLRKVLICGDFPDRRKCDKLKEKNVDVFFENEGLHSNDGNDELLITLLEAAAQVKSENRSQNIKWGIKQHAQSPDATAYSRPCYGYRKAKEGQLAVHDEEAGVVRMIFGLYLRSASILAIKRELEATGIKTPTGKDTWPKRTIETILSNGKYAGDALIYRTYCAKYPDKKRIKNQGQHEQLIIHNNHPPIVSKEQFEMVQLEKRRRTNVVVENDGTTKRKQTRYSVKSKATEGHGAPSEATDPAQ